MEVGMGLIDKDYLSDIRKDESTVAVRDMIKSKLSNIEFPDSEIHVYTCFMDKYDKTVIGFYGGLNGNGKWSNYFRDLQRLTDHLESQGIHVWLIQIDNDCLDDIFYIYLGVRL